MLFSLAIYYINLEVSMISGCFSRRCMYNFFLTIKNLKAFFIAVDALLFYATIDNTFFSLSVSSKRFKTAMIIIVVIKVPE